MTSNFHDGNPGSTRGDPCGATTAVRFVVYLTIAYLVSLGLAKSGSRALLRVSTAPCS